MWRSRKFFMSFSYMISKPCHLLPDSIKLLFKLVKLDTAGLQLLDIGLH